MEETDDIMVNNDLCELDHLIKTLKGSGVAGKLQKIRDNIKERTIVRTAWFKRITPMRDDWNRVACLLEIDPHNREEIFETLEDIRIIRDTVRKLMRGH